LRDGVERADLEQIAAIGLIKAADRYEAGHGTPFEAYAWVLILGELMHYVRDSERMLRAPRRIRDLERKWTSAERDLIGMLGRDPSGQEIASFVGASHEEEREVCRYREARSTISVDALHPFEHRVLSYTIDGQLDRVMIESGFHELSSVEREILIEIYERDTPILEVAQRLGYSRRHISRLHREALRKLFPYACPVTA
jgi:RNA polymerase sigma-B factor